MMENSARRMRAVLLRLAPDENSDLLIRKGDPLYDFHIRQVQALPFQAYQFADVYFKSGRLMEFLGTSPYTILGSAPL
jgi:hypothetical protein